jgi:hypothetical protein
VIDLLNNCRRDAEWLSRAWADPARATECSHINELVGQFEKVSPSLLAVPSALMDLGICLGDANCSSGDRRPRSYMRYDLACSRSCLLTNLFTTVLERLVRLAAACIKIRNYQYSFVVSCSCSFAALFFCSFSWLASALLASLLFRRSGMSIAVGLQQLSLSRLPEWEVAVHDVEYSPSFARNWGLGF